MSSFKNLILNEKGAYVYESTEDPRLNAFNKLLRGITVESISKLVNDIIKTNDKDMIKDLFVLIFHKRYCRGGEGEKLLSYHLILETYNHYPNIICKLIKLLPLYGYYKDYFEIWKIICELKIDEQTRFIKYQPLISEIVLDIKEQLKKDNDNTVSLLAKWMPRENSHYAKVCYWYVSQEKIDIVTYLANILNNVIPDLGNIKSNKWCLMKYRKLISELTKKLNVSETLMCSNKYSEIQYEKVASKAMKNYTKAFLNEKIKSTAPDCDETGNRYPDNKDRVLARNNLKKFILDGKLDKLNGKQLDPHEIIAKFNSHTSSLEKEILYSLWDRKKEDVLQSEKSFGKYIPMIDVSGSMCGGGTVEPINVALSLGIMASELACEPYKDMAISFSECPTIFKFDKDAKPDQKVEFIKEHHMGFSTQFGKAIDLLLEFCICNKIPENEVPSLLVFTDGQFDTMNNSSEDWRTCHKILTDKWIGVGYRECPTIVYWNLRAGTPGFHATSNYPGVQLLQGYSPSLMKFILFGDDTDMSDINEIKPRERPTPFETFKNIINQDVYKPILEYIDL
jgi:hypothetical protein